MRVVRGRSLVLAALAGLGVLAAAPRAHAGEHLRSQVHEELWYYWPDRWVSFYVQDMSGAALNVGPETQLTTQDLADASSAAFDAWTRQPCTDMVAYYEGPTADRESNMTDDTVNHRNTIIFRREDWDGLNCQDAIACTTVVTRRGAGEILDADIDLNLEEHEFVIQPIEGSLAFDLQSVLTHEVGHLFGLDHTQPEHPEAVMWPYVNWGDEATRRELAVDDVNTFCETYPSGECPVVNRFGDHICPETEIGGTCSACLTASSPSDDLTEAALASLALLGVGFLVARRKP